ncbi:MAG TPA: DUF5678 domain-containing protein [Blastocatellia bacterium]|nr:DUF5678 domain-containing protein [Blastocatellia bacterium]HMV82214.1 DUF5678 domain-containing protein [Blastocatellia bacterium]HMX27584.1 DUF5678 domain-containing protein [Blastocatellia bacterium]HMY75515.1 DUF5678 domain-containing protein [Blastocatellia bacterium]HMZ20947.1 DUF5678 domain-containing protein [Blastocatellia bacterium]
MPDINVENIFNQIVQLPPPERFRLWRMLEQVIKLASGQREQLEAAPPKRKLQPRPVPNKDREMQWLIDHARAYAGQWVALDGDRLIAHGPDAKEVYAAANADGAYLPLVTQVEDPDKIFIF